MKKILLQAVLYIFLLLPVASASSWDGYSQQEEFLVPPDLVGYCSLEYDNIKDDSGEEALFNCLTKLEDQRSKGNSQEREDAGELSKVVLSDYNVNAIAIASSNKSFVSTFMVEVDEEQAKGENENDDDGDAEIKTALDKIVATSRDGAIVMNKFLQQYSSILATKSYKAFHDENILKAKILIEANTSNPYDNGGVQ